MLTRPDHGFGLKDPMPYGRINEWVFSHDRRYVTELRDSIEEQMTAVVARKADIMEVSKDEL